MSILVPFMNRILRMGVSLIICTLVIGCRVRIVVGSWFRFILFLIYITGLLVLFGYMLAISSNNYYSKSRLVKFSFIFISLRVFIFMFNKIDLTGLRFSGGSFDEIIMLFINFNIIVYWLIGVLLFVSLVMVVTLCYKTPKPLRSFL